MRAQNGNQTSIRGFWFVSAILLPLTLWFHPAAAQRIVPDIKPVPRIPIYDPGNPVLKKVLKNGVTLLVQEQRTADAVAGAVALRMGTYYESDDDAGRSQLLIQTIAKGTQKYSPVELQLRLLAADATLRVGVGSDLAQIEIKTKREQVEKAADLLADVTLTPSFPDTSVENAIQANIDQLGRDKENPLRSSYHEFLATIYAGSPMSRPVGGTIGAISQCRQRDVLALYKRFFVGGNMVVCFVGNFDGKKLMTQLEKRFAAAPAGPAPVPAAGNPLPLAADTTITSERDNMLATCYTYGFQAPGYGDPDFAAFRIIESYLASGDRSPVAFWLPQNELVVSVGVLYPLYPKRSSMAVYFAANPATYETARDTVLTVMNRLKTIPIEETEYREQLKRVQNTQFLSQNNPVERARAMSQYEVAGLGYDFLRRYEESLLKLDAEGVRAAAERWFTHSCESVIGPSKNN